MKVLVGILVLMGCLTSLAAGDAKRGAMLYGRKVTPELKASKTKPANCVQCHKDGSGLAKTLKKINMMKGPKIAGLDEAYIIAQLKEIKTKKIKSGTTPAGNKSRKKNIGTMYTRIKKYTEQDFADLAAYVSKLGPAYKSEIWPR